MAEGVSLRLRRGGAGPAVVLLHGHRAGLHVDREIDEQSRRDGLRIRCPTLVGWSRHDDMLYADPAASWAGWCDRPPASAVIDSGHHMAEQAPSQPARVLTDFPTADQSADTVTPGDQVGLASPLLVPPNTGAVGLATSMLSPIRPPPG